MSLAKIRCYLDKISPAEACKCSPTGEMSRKNGKRATGDRKPVIFSEFFLMMQDLIRPGVPIDVFGSLGWEGR